MISTHTKTIFYFRFHRTHLHCDKTFTTVRAATSTCHLSNSNCQLIRELLADVASVATLTMTPEPGRTIATTDSCSKSCDDLRNPMEMTLKSLSYYRFVSIIGSLLSLLSLGSFLSLRHKIKV